MAGAQRLGDFSVLLLPVLLALGVQGLKWNDNVGTELQTCTGQKFEFDWKYTLDQSNEMEIRKYWTAVLNGKTVDLISQRNTDFQFKRTGGLTLKSASQKDSGKYTLTVEVSQTSPEGTKKYLRTASLLVAEPPRTEGFLMVEQNPNATYDHDIGGWHVHLACGPFVSLGYPHVNVVWKVIIVHHE
ncbi:hypothetical protein BaRGS_00035897 [Batillaria attramentaria]|uniref:Immunoglobulin V-set domain-containing protein n=1 Tax=Batillaria attramentaria TaxID=370345 RepID=A0ABD0JDC0_9CAEN